MNVIYVDDEKPAIDNFTLTTAGFPEIRELHTFQSGEEALCFAEQNAVDAAFLDVEMPGITGLELAARLKEITPHTRVVFVTAFSQYALDAWSVDAVGYLLKPYTASDIHKELAKCSYRPIPSQRVVIDTIPTLSVMIDGKPLNISGTKPRELLALLVERGETGFTVGEGIACLWPDRPNDPGTRSLFRMTYKRLADALEAAGAGDLLVTGENYRAIRVDKIECDLYRILAGDPQAARKYNGVYLRDYAWAEERNAQLYWLVAKERIADA